MNHITIIVALAVGISLFYVLVNNTMIIYAQQLPSSSSHSLSSVLPASTINTANTSILQGPNNKITAKYTCSSNPLTASFYSVDVSGVPVAATATAPTGKRTN